MREPGEGRRGKGSGAAVWAVLAPLLLLALYVLSAIPVALGGGFRLGAAPAWVDRLYAPLAWLHDNTPLRQPLEGYAWFLVRLSPEEREP